MPTLHSRPLGLIKRAFLLDMVACYTTAKAKLLPYFTLKDSDLIVPTTLAAHCFSILSFTYVAYFSYVSLITCKLYQFNTNASTQKKDEEYGVLK
jgi:hypothetical protein